MVERMLIALLFSALTFCICGTSTVEINDAPGSCQSMDCVEAAPETRHLSLLQGSMSLHKAEVHKHEAKSEVLDGVKNTTKMGKDITVILAVFAVFILVVYFGCVSPAFAIHAETKEKEKAPHRQGGHHALAFVVNSHPDVAEMVENRIHDVFEEDAYSLAIVLLVRDLQSLARGEGSASLKKSRIAYVFVLLVLTVGLTIGLVVCTKQFVTPLQVADIRDAYDKFESHMYMNHTYKNVNGKARGSPGFFNASMFDTFSDIDKKAACNIPFSQINWIACILLVWSVTCLASIKKCIEMFMALVVFGETKDSRKDMIVDWKQALVRDTGDKTEQEPDDKSSPPVLVIIGLTMGVKALLSLAIFLPEFGTTCYILWLGCRWLVATNDFGNLIGNAVALEFVLQLKCMVFIALASERNKNELKYTGVSPPWSKEGAGYGIYFNTLYWAVFTVLWVYLYIFHLQSVLPDYHWDVRQVCNTWLLGQLSNH